MTTLTQNCDQNLLWQQTEEVVSTDFFAYAASGVCKLMLIYVLLCVCFLEFNIATFY